MIRRSKREGETRHGYCMKATLLFVVLSLLLTPIAQAQTYSQPMLGVSWHVHKILVNVPSDPSWARSAIEEAMADWNTAQSWFIQTYSANQTSAKFTFVDAMNLPNPQVNFAYVDDMGQTWTGSTELPIQSPPTNETVLLVLSRLAGPTDVLQVVEHELGHVLGLDHTQISVDLMYPAQDEYTGGEPTYPSTLNLYGVYLLALGCTFSNTDSVSLPPQIPYVEWYPRISQESMKSSTPQTQASTNSAKSQFSCPHKKDLWQEPSLLAMPTLMLVVVCLFAFKAHRKKPPRPSEFMSLHEAINAHRMRCDRRQIEWY